MRSLWDQESNFVFIWWMQCSSIYQRTGLEGILELVLFLDSCSIQSPDLILMGTTGTSSHINTFHVYLESNQSAEPSLKVHTDDENSQRLRWTRCAHLHRQDVYVETDEPPRDHQSPHDVLLLHHLPHPGDLQFHQLPQDLLVRLQPQHVWSVVVWEHVHCQQPFLNTSCFSCLCQKTFSSVRRQMVVTFILQNIQPYLQLFSPQKHFRSLQSETFSLTSASAAAFRFS